MSLKDCQRLIKALDPDDRDAFNDEFRMATENELMSKAEAMTDAAEAVMDFLVAARNQLADDIAEKGGHLDKITLEHLVNPKSYTPGARGDAADIAKLSAEEFDALLESVAPAPKDTKPAPKEPKPYTPAGEMTDVDAEKWIRDRRGKKFDKATAKEMKQVARAAGIEGYSAMDKATVSKALQDWYEQRLFARLPEPSLNAATQLRAGLYTHPSSFTKIVVNSEDPAIGAWARHYGSSVEKKATTYDGGKTEKGYHMDSKQFEDFMEGYTGKKVNMSALMDTQGELYAVPLAPEPVEALEVGDEVIVHPEGDRGEITGFETDALGNELPVVRVIDSDGKMHEGATSAKYLQKVPPRAKSADAKEALKNAAKHGVKGADEALTGLAELFGGKSKFTSGFVFDEDTYAKAKPHFKKSLEEFVAAGKSLKEFLQFILENFGEGIKPYLRQFHQDVSDGRIEIKGVNDVQPTAQAQAGTIRPRAQPADQVDTADAGARAAGVPDQADQRPAETEGIPDSRVGLPVDSTAVDRKPGDTDVLGDTGEFAPAARPAGRGDTGRGADTRAEGVPAQTPGSRQAQANARATVERNKLRPTTDTWVPSDPQNIAESLPRLFPEQQDDVVFAEHRLFDNGARGVMFTNGTGTGKTYTGLGLAKRFVMQGKDNIIITVPGEKVAADWIERAEAVQLNITKLRDTKDAGSGVVITTYKNFSDNDELVKRDWDLVIHDEAHKLSENMDGNPTNALKKSRAITGHPDGMYTYAEAMERELLDKIRGLRDQAEHFRTEAELNFESADSFYEAAEKLDAEAEDLYFNQWIPKRDAHFENRRALWNANVTKRLDLTATPFAYEKSVDHAEGFLFEYDRSLDDNQAYNAPNGREAFMIEHFGYRMRTNKLTEPEADVDRGLMQRQFNEWLKKQGALRGRVLTVDHDYSREFVAIDDLVGSKIDEGWNLIRRRAMDKDHPLTKGYQIMEKKLRRAFNYNARVKMLEAIKARHAVDRARQHMALGRKVVLFHSRIQGGTRNPFHTFLGAATKDFENLQEAAKVLDADESISDYIQAATEFVEERQDLMTLNINTVRPLDLFAQEFGDQMTVYNGTISRTAKRENPDKFNKDDGEIYVIAVQDEGGKEGISLHDATGANQRVLINLGLPVRPTQAIQIEGRIYRVGQMSNAIFEYFNTGTNFERFTFAEKISERASTAENLAMGEQARSLRDSFIDAYEDPSFEAPSKNQGVGGKEIDRANWEATSEFERAKTHYFGTQKTKGKRDQRQGLDYFATPEPLGLKMVEWSGVRPNESALEPSAGHGAIARYFPENVNATFVEPSNELLSRLMLRAPGQHREMRFEDLDVGGNKYHAIVMNPPFGNGGATAIAHLNKAMHHLKNGGRIVALIPEGPAADKKFDNMFYGKEGELEQLQEAVKTKRKTGGSIAKETRRIDDLTNFHLRASISLPPITFTRAGTAIRARVVVIDKIENTEATVVQQPPRELHADTINELFDKIEDMTVPERTKLEDTPEEYLVKEGLVVVADLDNGLWRIKGRTYDHRHVIKRALGDAVQFNRADDAWVSTVDPTVPIYKAMTQPQAEAEAQPTPPTQADIQAAAAALFSGRGGKIPSPAPAPLGGLVVAVHKTAAGKDVWRVTGNTKEHKEMLKQLGGRWYRPAQAWTFFDGDPTEQIKAELEKPLAMRAGHATGVTARQVKEWLRVPLKRISSRVPIEIVDNRNKLVTATAIPDDAKGIWVRDRAALFADNIYDKRDAEIALTHEVVGHLGVIGVLGHKKTNELIGDITNLKVEEMLAPGTHPELAKVLETLRRNYSDEQGNYTLDPKTEALEVIAHIAHSKPRLGPLVEIYNKIINWFRQQFARWGIVDPTMAKIEDAIVRSVDYVRDPPAHYTGEGPDGVAAMRVYHVSSEEFDAFEMDKAATGKGTGTMNYGFGHYFTSTEEAAEYFHRLFAGEGRAQTYTYEAWIEPQSEELMRWQDPYALQPPGVRDALSMLLEMSPERFEALDVTGGTAYRKAQREIKSGTDLGNRIKDIARTRGVDIEGMPADRIVSIALHQLGVRGVRYHEQSRGLPRMNYVIFSDEDVRITRRTPKAPRGPLAMRAPRRDQPRPGEDPAEFERYKKLGLQGRKTLWERINNLRLKVIIETMDTFALRSYEGIFDGLIEIKRKEIEAGVGVGANDYENSAYVSARLATGVADMMTHILHFGPLRWYRGVTYHAGSWRNSAGELVEFRGLLEVFNELGIDKLNDWLMWMGANRARQLMAEGRERNLSEEDIAAGLAKAEGNEELFMRIKDEYAAMNKAMLNLAEEAGLIDPIKRAEWESEWYVPFYRISEGELEGPRIKRGLSHQEAGIRRLFGAELPTNDLLENILTNWLKLTDASVKNHALRLMVDNFKETDYITSETMRFTKQLVPRSEIRKRVVADRQFAIQVANYLGMEETANNLEIINEINQIPASGFEQLWALTKPKDPDIIQIKRNGKNEYWRVHVPGLLRAVGHVSEQSSQQGFFKMARGFKRLLTTGVTASPDFMLRNFIRDAAHAWAINPDGFKFGIDSIAGLQKAMSDDPLYRAAMASGASFQGGYVHGTDPEASAQILRRELERAGLQDDVIHAHIGSIIHTPRQLKSAGLRYWQMYRNVGDKIENANRLSTLQAAIDAGKPLAQALFESKDLMDYSRRGNAAWLIAFTDMIPFLNARMQGIDRLGRAIRHDPKIVALKFGKILAFTAVLALLNDDEERYRELKDWEKDAYWHVFPFGEHIRIPKPFEIGALATIFERAQRVWLLESQPSDKLKWSIMHNLMETLNINPIPQFALPVIEVIANRSFYFDAPIESLSDEGVIPQERYSATTSNTAIALREQAAWIGLSPKQLEHIYVGYTGTMGAYVLSVADMLVRGVSDQPTRPAIQAYEWPILRSVYQGKREKGTQWETDFYDRVQEARELHGTMRRYLEKGQRDRARQFREEHAPKLQMRRTLERGAKMFNQLRDRRDKILRDDSLSPAEKYRKQQAIQVRINQLAKRLEAHTREAFAE